MPKKRLADRAGYFPKARDIRNIKASIDRINKEREVAAMVQEIRDNTGQEHLEKPARR